ncbi:hypothetical protein MABM_46540 [Mycobacteroides abscessus]|nr:hypothetical protein MABM_46540 [Mycobacteroides abscessus]
MRLAPEADGSDPEGLRRAAENLRDHAALTVLLDTRFNILGVQLASMLVTKLARNTEPAREHLSPPLQRVRHGVPFLTVRADIAALELRCRWADQLFQPG